MKQQTHGPNRSPNEQFQSKLWLYQNVDIKKNHIDFLILQWSWSVKHDSSSPKDNLCFVEICPFVLERRFIFNYVNVFFLLLSPLWKQRGLLFEEMSIPFTQECFLKCLVEIDRVVKGVTLHLIKQTTLSSFEDGNWSYFMSIKSLFLLWN